ncbi:MAG TPA: hypothetical protein VFU90_02105, partial [Candidatus Tumulicola sp.]|nr:hypothetical protein [Candidatus Tumulicola sp.]
AEGTAAAPPPNGKAPAPSAGVASLIEQAQSHYDRAIAAQRAGDWSAYGKQIDSLGAVLTQLRSHHP